MYRRTFNKALIAGLLLPITTLRQLYATEKMHIVEMLNTAPETSESGNHHDTHENHDNQSLPHTNVFAPDILEIKPGDSVTFVPTDSGHNSAAKRGMVPDGTERWNSPLDKEFTVTLNEPGVYGYVCIPHYEMGMVGLIIVRENPTDDIPNLAKAKKVRHPGAAKKAFKKLFTQLEEQEKQRS